LKTTPFNFYHCGAHDASKRKSTLAGMQRVRSELAADRWVVADFAVVILR